MSAAAQALEDSYNAGDLSSAGDDSAEPKYETIDGQPYADDFSNLSLERVAELRAVCTKFDQRDEWARMIELIRCTLRRYFYIGIQHPYWNADAMQFQVGPAGATLGGEEDGNGEEFFEEEFNIFTANAKIFMAVFAQNAAPSRMEPDRPKDGASVKAAREAEKYVEVYQKYNPPKCAQMEVARLMWTDGRVMAATEYAVDEEKCGVDAEGNPQGTEFTEYGGVLEWKVPVVGQFKHWPYAKRSKEKDITVAQDENPKVADRIEAAAKGQVPNNEIARMSRIAVDEGIAQVSADTLAYLVTEDTWWLRPCAFRVLDKEKRAFWIGDKNSGISGIAQKGFRAKFIGTVFCAAKAISMEAQIRCMHALPGTGNARPSLSDPMVPIQMEFNDAVGMYSELIHKCIPRTFLNVGVESMPAILEQFSRWGEYSSMQPANGLPLSDNIFQESHLDVPASFPAWVQNLQGPLSQFITGNQPALFGANMEDQKTAAGYAQARDMSLGLMAIVWVPYLEFASTVRWQAARLAAQREQSQLHQGKTISAVLPTKDKKSKTVDIDVGVLKRGGFLSSAITDQNFPESYTATSNKWLGLFQAAPTNPIALQVFQEPDNLVALKDATGLDIVIKGAAARDKQLAEWDEMQAGDGPIPDLQATDERDQQKQQAAQQATETLAPGTPAPPLPEEPPIETSSVPIRLADDHIEEARTCVRILNDSKTLEMLTDAPDVVHDLELHLVAHLTKAQSSGIQIPPDLLGIVPPLPAPPGALPGPQPVPAGALAGPTKTHKPPLAAGATPAIAPPLVPSPTGVPNAAATV